MSSLQQVKCKSIDIFYKERGLFCKIFKKKDTKAIQSIIYYVDANMDIIHLAAKFNIENPNKWNYSFNPQILRDAEICKFHEWMIFRNNCQWVLLYDTIQEINLEEIDIEYNNDASLELLKIALRICEKFRIILRSKLHIYMRETPFVLLNQYYIFLSTHLVAIPFIEESIKCMTQLLNWLNHVYNKSFVDKLKGPDEIKLDSLLLKIKPDLKQYNYQSKTIHSKELLSNLYFIYYYPCTQDL